MALGLTPRVLVDDATRLVIEESHFGPAALWASGLFLAGIVSVSAAQSGSLEVALITLLLGAVLVGVPFLIVLACSKYRRLEVRRGAELVSVTVYRLRPPRSVRVCWDEVRRVVCERRRDSSPKPGRMVLTLHTVDGAERRLLAGWYSEPVKAILHRHFTDKFDAVETVAGLKF